MEAITLALSSAASFVQIGASIAASGSVFAAAGRMPRAGPLRAVALAGTSRFLPIWSRTTVSQRTEEVAALRASLRSSKKDQFVVVTGPKGVGKSCLVETAVRDGWGVVHVSVAAGKPRDEIVAAVWKATTRSALSPSFDNEPGARRVLLFHRLVFHCPVTVVLHATERQSGDSYAQISAACRLLADFGYRVIVDSSHNSLDNSALATLREEVFMVDPMPRSMTEALTGLEDLAAALAAKGLADVVWSVLGGYPAAYQELDTAWASAGRSADITPTVEGFVTARLLAAMRLRDAAVAVDSKWEQVFLSFRTDDSVTADTILALGLSRASPDKVLRDAACGGQPVVVPATPALAFVLRHHLSAVPTLHAMKSMR